METRQELHQEQVPTLQKEDDEPRDTMKYASDKEKEVTDGTATRNAPPEWFKELESTLHTPKENTASQHDPGIRTVTCPATKWSKFGPGLPRPVWECPNPRPAPTKELCNEGWDPEEGPPRVNTEEDDHPNKSQQEGDAYKPPPRTSAPARNSPERE